MRNKPIALDSPPFFSVLLSEMRLDNNILLSLLIYTLPAQLEVLRGRNFFSPRAEVGGLGYQREKEIQLFWGLRSRDGEIDYKLEDLSCLMVLSRLEC